MSLKHIRHIKSKLKELKRKQLLNAVNDLKVKKLIHKEICTIHGELILEENSVDYGFHRFEIILIAIKF